MNIHLYVLYFLAICSFYVAINAWVRVAKMSTVMRDLDWEAVANILGDIGTVKRSITRLNGKLNGMESPKYDVEQEIARAMQQPRQRQTLQGG